MKSVKDVVPKEFFDIFLRELLFMGMSRAKIRKILRCRKEKIKKREQTLDRLPDEAERRRKLIQEKKKRRGGIPPPYLPKN